MAKKLKTAKQVRARIKQLEKQLTMLKRKPKKKPKRRKVKRIKVKRRKAKRRGKKRKRRR